MKTLTEEAYEVKRKAEAGSIGKRKSSFELYALLADCMALAERCEGSLVDRVEMRKLVAQQEGSGNRKYVEARSDAFIIVCRFVFHDLRSDGASRSNASRYAMCLREARKLNIRSDKLAEYLRDKGGINSLFMARPLTAVRFQTKCLNLDRAINILKGQPFCLTLRRLPDNRYEVIDAKDLHDLPQATFGPAAPMVGALQDEEWSALKARPREPLAEGDVPARSQGGTDLPFNPPKQA